MKELMDNLEEIMKDFKENIRIQDDMVFPLEVSGIKNVSSAKNRRDEEVGSWVSIRPCDSEKTYLGVLLGDMHISTMHTYHLKTKELTASSHKNPAIYVPDLKRIVWGYESWWGVINSPEKLRKITDIDIENVWYVKALKELTKEGADDGVGRS